MSHPGIVVYGAGGHGKSVVSVLRALGHEVVAVVDDDPATWGRLLLGVPVVGPDAEPARAAGVAGVIAIGDNAARKALAERHAGRPWLTVVHPQSYVNPSARLGPGSVVFPFAVVGAEASLGAHVILNAQSTVGHDCVVGDYAHLAAGVHVAGGVRVAEGAFLGIGSVVVPGVCVGAWSTVGAGATLGRDLPDGAKLLGAPARRV